MDELTRERYGPVLPIAEVDRQPWWRHRDGRPDTPEKVAQRRRDLDAALSRKVLLIDEGWVT